MTKSLAWRVGMILVFILLSLLYLTPTLHPSLPSWWGGLLPKDKIHLGLDLQGGTHLVMEVKTQKSGRGRARPDRERPGRKPEQPRNPL
jgi:preprotein translocase subunit SecD